MTEREDINNLLQNCCAGLPPALTEFLLIRANVFFRMNAKKVTESLGEKEGEKYRKYIAKVRGVFSGDDDRDDPYIADIVEKGLKIRDERLSEAILYSVFIYPMRV